MRRRPGHIFVAWGNNRTLAEKLVEEFHSRQWNAVLGGDESAPITSPYIGENIRNQMSSAAAAVILVEDFGQKEAREGVFRPNLMLEWGYALSVLPNNLIVPALIGLERSRLPSDLQGVWAPTYDAYRTSVDEVTESSLVDKIASRIATDVLNRINSVEVSFPTGPYDVMYNWPQVEVMLYSVVQQRRSILERHLRLLIPNLAMPAVYDSKREELSNVLRDLRQSHVNISQEAALVSLIFEYYAECERARLDENKLRQFRTAFNSQTKIEFPSLWARIISRNFAGIVERKLAEICHADANWHFENSAKLLTEADKMLTGGLASGEIDRDSFNMWRGFVSWNRFKTYSKMGAATYADDEYTKARDARRTIFNALKGSNVTSRIQSEFVFEYLISELHAAQLGLDDGGADTNDIIEHIRALLSKNSRAIGRAIAALEEYAFKNKIPLLVDRLEKIKSVIYSK